MRIGKRRNLLKGVLLTSALSITVLVVVLLYLRHNGQPEIHHPQQIKLPDDVVRVMEGYVYRETNDGFAIDLSGNRVVYRGRQILGLRSNLIKTSYFETIRGTLRSEKMKVTFSADDAEWNSQPASPLLLRRNVMVSVNGRPRRGVKTARIYFQQRILEVSGDRKETIQFK